MTAMTEADAGAAAGGPPANSPIDYEEFEGGG